jgi:acetone carboxylase, beta subunit
MAARVPLVLGIDAGGTMTDTFLVDEKGGFEVGKAPTTPRDESVGFLESTEDAITQWDQGLDQMFDELSVCLYSGTTMLNTLLSRRGEKVGLIVTKGFEDMLLMNQGLSWAGYSYADTLHVVTHLHPDPLTSRRLVKGVSERVDMFGDVAIPLYEHEVRDRARELIEEKVDAVCICMLFSHLNRSHEERAAEIVAEVAAEAGVPELPVFTSAYIRPVMREQSRLNSVMIEAYAAAPVRRQLNRVQERIHEHGFGHPLQTVLSYGGLSNIEYPRLHETLVSGPIGGILGAQYVSKLIGEENVMVSDLGGTSFDLGAITSGNVPVDAEPVLARFKMNLPTIALESIGAGSGTLIKLDPVSKKIELGPESAQADPGPVCFDRGGDKVAVADCMAVMGYFNKDNFLGGRIKLNVEIAEEALREQITDPLGVDLFEGAEGITRMLELSARDALQTVASARGLNTSDYVLMGYGGAGPLHLAGYSDGLDFKGIMTFPFAAAFSAFGCTTADYLHRYSQSVMLGLGATSTDEEKMELASAINAAWEEMEASATEEMKVEGRGSDDVEFSPVVMMRYAGQLTDLELVSPLPRLQTPEDVDNLIAAWEELYERINSRVSKYREAGFQIMELGLLARIEKVKPRFEKRPLGSAEPTKEAFLGERKVYRDGIWHDARLYDMDSLEPGNVVEGFAIVEHPATTFVVPPAKRAEVDEWGFIWLR